MAKKSLVTTVESHRFRKIFLGEPYNIKTPYRYDFPKRMNRKPINVVLPTQARI